ncbi:GNAT family N-acetyltransferase [Mangrovicoccus algicola]|uniref:GNAT family N-acetyltransferase n=1 Tax=Mangrovicoccus algicola TaxID=2771008 RepID=A0A8J7D100_9RHOB|nr:GNAT family N-acetyltransferase [Mangrovicoccus algicola]MBE3640168.1 GNAT family N-acetyltransferase [Mangrovicoccus algicola]
MNGIEIVRADAAALDRACGDLCGVLADCVAAGAAVGFLAPLSAGAARGFWQDTVRPALAAGERRLFLARDAGRVVGTVQLLIAMPPNQPHRCEIAKMMVHPGWRRRGIGRALMGAALAAASAAGRRLVTLDTKQGDAAEPLYRGLGFETAGVIPDYARDPEGGGLHATVLMYRRLDPEFEPFSYSR